MLCPLRHFEFKGMRYYRAEHIKAQGSWWGSNYRVVSLFQPNIILESIIMTHLFIKLAFHTWYGTQNSKMILIILRVLWNIDWNAAKLLSQINYFNTAVAVYFKRMHSMIIYSSAGFGLALQNNFHSTIVVCLLNNITHWVAI